MPHAPRNRVVLIVTTLVVLGFTPPRVSAGENPLRRLFGKKSPQEIAKTAENFIGRIQCRAMARADEDMLAPHRSYQSGSAVLFHRDGTMLTNEHVVRGADSCVVFLKGIKYPATILGKDPISDLAAIRIRGKKFSPVPFGDSSRLRSGDTVFTFGFPDDFNKSKPFMTQGIIGNAAIRIASSPLFYYIGTDAQAYFGNSGGAQLDANGRFIGITAQVLDGTSYSFFIPINEARALILRLSEGNVVRGVLQGLVIVDVADIRLDLSLFDECVRRGILPPDIYQDGIVVLAVSANTPAAEAGFQIGDIITHINGRFLRDHRDFFYEILDGPPGTLLNVTVVRRGAELVTRIRTTARRER